MPESGTIAPELLALGDAFGEIPDEKIKKDKRLAKERERCNILLTSDKSMTKTSTTPAMTPTQFVERYLR